MKPGPLLLHMVASCLCSGILFAQESGANHRDTVTVYVNSTRNLRNRFIPAEVFEMTNLRALNISGMDCDYGDTTTCWMIREIPPQIRNLKKLESLSLTLHAITVIPPEITALRNLRTLDLTDNPGLSDIAAITTLPQLETLSLFGCNLTALPADINKLQKLKYLGLSGNRLSEGELARIRKALPGCQIAYDP